MQGGGIMSFEITGIDELLAKFEKIGSNIEQKTKQALNDGAEVIKQSAKQKCPRSTQEGQHLADNIIISDVKNGIDRKPYVEIGPQKSDNNDYFYGKFIEFGTVKMKAHPFMEPAFLEKRQEALNKIADVIREAIQSG